MKAIANAMGIYAEDQSLWSDTKYVRRMLFAAGVEASVDKIAFKPWHEVPDLALVAIKHRSEGDNNFWHWVVFQRVDEQPIVIDSAKYLASNIRTDFRRMHPKW